ncbi:MAG: cytochrome c maturation protein CcmE [Actinomycetes bacterium]
MSRRAWVAVALCATALVAVVALAVQLSGNVVYYRTVSEALDRRSDTARFRLAGAVVPDSIVETRNGVRFEVTDGRRTVVIAHRGDPPQLFKAGAPVLCEGRWAEGSAARFDSDRIMIKHGEEYTPPKVRVTTTTTLPVG